MELKRYRHPVIFYSLSVIIPWVCWFILAAISNSPSWSNPRVVFWASLLGVAGLAGPMITAFALIFPDKEMRGELLNSLINFKGIKAIYWILTFAVFPVSILLAQAISLLFGNSPEQFRLVEHMSFSAGIFPAWFLLVIAPIMEEFGWHTYGIHCLRQRWNLIVTCVIFGIIWGVWHMPLSFVKGYYQNVLVSTGVLYSANFLLSLIPYLIIDNWLYYKTNRNMFLEVAFHFMAGFSNEVFRTHPDSKVIQTGLLLIFAVVLVIKENEFFFSKKHEVILH
jgi:membrane protease YdiL (CAAX protease family)